MNLPAEDLEQIVARTGRVWDALRGQKIFVTGGTGFFGRWLMESFAYANSALRLDAQMVVLTRDPERFKQTAPHLVNDHAIRLVTGDVRTFTSESVREQLDSQSPREYRFVVHAAAELSAERHQEDPLAVVDTIVAGTRAALDFAVQSGAHRFLLTSSGAVYGPQPADLAALPENYRGAPDTMETSSAYAEAKRLAELLCVCYQRQHGLGTVVARCFSFIGPGLPLSSHFAISSFVADALRGGPVRFSGEGSSIRSYLYASDLAVWLWTVLHRGRPGVPYNVGSEKSITVRDLAEAVAQAAEVHALSVPTGSNVSSYSSSRYVPDTRRARSTLELEETVHLEQAIRKTLAALRL